MTNRRKILLVDDEEGFTDVVKINLELGGTFDVAVVNNPLQAVDTARAYQPDIVVLDIVMPEMDGGDLLAEMRRDGDLKDIPVIMLTALVSTDDLDGKALTPDGGEVMLAKPVTAAKLIDTIEAKLAGRI